MFYLFIYVCSYEFLFQNHRILMDIRRIESARFLARNTTKNPEKAYPWIWYKCHVDIAGYKILAVFSQLAIARG